MRRLSGCFLALVFATACRGADRSPRETLPPGAATRAPADPLARAVTARALLGLARDLGDESPEDEASAIAELGRIAALVRRAADRAADRSDPIPALNDVLFGALGFAREVEDTDLRFVFLPSVLRERRGSCVGLGSLYLALADAMGVEIEAVMRPGHFYVRTTAPDGRHRNAELLRRGESMPDAWYEARFPIPPGAGSEYGRSLSLAEVLAVVEYDVGNERRRAGRLAAARRAYERATAHFPSFAEAQASLGATLHLLGALDEAARAYEAARRANPRLGGLEENTRLLEDERAAAAGAR